VFDIIEDRFILYALLGILIATVVVWAIGTERLKVRFKQLAVAAMFDDWLTVSEFTLVTARLPCPPYRLIRERTP
jgi:hypothetical protein